MLSLIAGHLSPNMSTPSFDDLPLRKDGPRGNAWGLYGSSDQSGMLNRLTPENTARAAKEIVDGTRVSTDWYLGAMTPPCFGRQALEHNIIHKAPRFVNDDVVTFNTQSSTQWDGLRHFGYQKEKVFFNGRTQEEVMNSDVNGIHGKSKQTLTKREKEKKREKADERYG